MDAHGTLPTLQITFGHERVLPELLYFGSLPVESPGDVYLCLGRVCLRRGDHRAGLALKKAAAMD
jgi:hypothetical protein